MKLGGSFPRFVTSDLCQALKIPVEFPALRVPVGRAERLIHGDGCGLRLCGRQTTRRQQHFTAAAFPGVMHPSAGSTVV